MYVALEQSNKLGTVKSRVWEVFPTYTVSIHGHVCEEKYPQWTTQSDTRLEARPCMRQKIITVRYTPSIHGRVSLLI